MSLFLCFSKVAKVASLAYSVIVALTHDLRVPLRLWYAKNDWPKFVYSFQYWTIAAHIVQPPTEWSGGKKFRLPMVQRAERNDNICYMFFFSNEYWACSSGCRFFVCICVQPHDDNLEFVYIIIFLLNREKEKKRANLRTGKWLLSLLFVAHLLLPPNVYCRCCRLNVFRSCAWLAINARLSI